ncbi:cationic amino acid transporter 1 [Cajanus cajan]|uniref:Cationic amino acid transporter 3 n=1 Tax=Cajanus cajan TaxID=3821 RepID=A0A151TKL3_CAJCA|nr:cationic amino acid transporter 1 [Cajanus cajan]KYP67601.1 Cationic amino acid transporter 3 [Cajanus cajan]
METEGGNRVARRRACTFERDDFFPEESFRSWGSYGKALWQTPKRFKTQVMTRSKDETELVALKGRSSNEMKKTLNSWDLIWFGIGAVIGSGIFVITGLEARDAAGPAVILSFIVSGLSALLSVFCYTEFAVEIPVAGGSFAYLRVELGDLVAFIAAGNILLEYVIGGAAISRSWTSYFATLCNKQPDEFRIIIPNMDPDYSHLDPIAVVVLIAIAMLAMFSTKTSSVFNNVATIIHSLILVFIVIAGFIKADPQNLTPFAPYGARGVIKASAVLFFAYLGFDAVSTMAEETKNPARDIPVGLVGSMTITTIIYCLLSLTLCLVQSYKDIDVDAPFSVAFHAVGWDWAKYIVALGALKGMTTVLLVTIVGESRYLTHIARTHMMPPWFGHVDEKTGTPVNATVAMIMVTAVIAFFTNFRVLSNLLSISTLLIFMLVAVALLVRRYYSSGVTTKGNQVRLIVCLVLIMGSSCGISGLWAKEVDGWVGYAICVVLWVLGSGGLCVFVPMAKQPKRWGVPLVPWLPALSILINVLLLGSIDVESYIRFAVWTAFLLVYYALVGVHASYDTAKDFECKRNANQVEVEVEVEVEIEKVLNQVERGVHAVAQPTISQKC